MLNWKISSNGYRAKVGKWWAEVQIDGMRRGKTCCGLQPPTNEELANATYYIASFDGRTESGFTNVDLAKEAAEEMAAIVIYAAADQLGLL